MGTSCYDQIKTRGLTCPSATQMFHKDDFHNPFKWNENMKDKSDKEIQSKCCRPLNKCHIKLHQMGLNCDGIGQMPGDTEDLKYDFNPLALTNADDVRNKCCKPNCFSTMKKRKLKCTTGVARSQWDGHQPFSNGFAKQTDERILQECCSENCYSHFKAKGLKCSTGVVRGKEDFHHVNFKSLNTKGLEQECCRTSCSDQFKSHGMSCGAGYNVKDDERSNMDWSHMDKGDLKKQCCEELSEDCKKANAKRKPYGEWKKRVAVLNNVTYLD